ncbi:MAG: YggS family pyridoxal phosphate-dependent enzyme [Bacteroidales bacterium]|nr:YggS family pyridoxal phosphate-dependent enzyme [Bacteroidales bacterium]
MMIAENIAKIRAELPEGVRLIAVSKLKPVEDIQEAYAAGQRLFGENYATELRDKHPQLPNDIEWHFIGHLQGKQLKYYIPFVSMIHGVDSIEHLEEVEKAAVKAGRIVDVLLQVHVAQEETKFGFLPEELENLDNLVFLGNLEHTRICGVMGMASHTDDEARVRADFRAIRAIFDHLKAGPFVDHPEFKEVSMGMSHDWRIAVEEGSTLIRLGTSIFGPRDYSKIKN